jgi:GNAT superfamily N-acetyltransferase
MPSTKPTITICLATLLEHREIGRIASETYFHTPLTKFLSPHAGEYYSHYERGFTQRALKRMLDPRNLTFVAVDEAIGKPIGHIQAERLGDDAFAQAQIQSRKSVWLWALKLLFTIWCTVLDFVVGCKSDDAEALRLFAKWGERDEEKYWMAFAERGNRWHVQSFVVRREYQGLGIGKRLMREVIGRAERENVRVGLESSAEGEGMYRSVGFELLGRFDQQVDFVKESEGGVMMWSPKGWKGT